MKKEFTIALAGNPNVGKSTIFNALTGMHQKTGNWAGKTVACASGYFRYRGIRCPVVDLPGTYSLQTHSEEEEIAREYIASGEAELLLIVCDATCPERGLRLLKQIQALEHGTFRPEHDTAGTENGASGPQLVLCVNLCDEAKKKGIVLDIDTLSERLGIPVIPCTARSRQGLADLKEMIYDSYQRWEAVSGCPAAKEPAAICQLSDFSPSELTAETISYRNPAYLQRQIQIDRIVTGPLSGGLIMLAMLLGIFWLTITGANYPSALLWDLLFALEKHLAEWLARLGTSEPVLQALVYGVYRVVAWVVSVMLPPMAIFFPLFTLLEDFGYLPRAAFNMDPAFKKCKACGKQCLTMCFVNT